MKPKQYNAYNASGNKIEKLNKYCPKCAKYYVVSDYMSKCQVCKTPFAHAKPVEQPNTPHCPTCGSTNLRKIGNLERGLSVTVWGFGSSKMGKQYECKDCGYKF